MKAIGEHLAEVPQRVPDSFKATRRLRPKLASAARQKFVQELAPGRLAVRGIVGSDLSAHSRLVKHADQALPARRSEIDGCEGVELMRSMLADYVVGAAALRYPSCRRSPATS